MSTLLTCFFFSYSCVVFFKKLVFIRNSSQNLKLVFLHLDKVDRALARSRLYSINLHKPGDGNQDLVFIMREPEDVLRDLIFDPVFFLFFRINSYFQICFRSYSYILQVFRAVQKGRLYHLFLSIEAIKKTSIWFKTWTT